MKLNLLPDKYIKNRAPMLLLSGYVIFVGVIFVLIMVFFGLLTLSVTKQKSLVTLRKVEQIKLTKNIKDLKNVNSVEVQDAIKVLKEKQILTNQVVKVLQETFDKSEAVLWNYELKVMSDSGANAAVARTFDNKELVSLTLNAAANYYGKDGVKKVIADLETIPWIYSAMLETSSLREGTDDIAEPWANLTSVHDLTIQVQLIKDDLPSIARSDK